MKILIVEDDTLLLQGLILAAQNRRLRVRWRDNRADGGTKP
ncbi:Transcriptional regulatory protein BasR [Escherichia coli]|nr:Transcriptional regulatory protein BasR [Escherichia coli]